MTDSGRHAATVVMVVENTLRGAASASACVALGAARVAFNMLPRPGWYMDTALAGVTHSAPSMAMFTATAAACRARLPAMVAANLRCTPTLLGPGA